MTGEVILQAVDIDKSFGGVPVLKQVNLEISRGEVHALMGENGAGKSTLIKIITGAYQKDGGQLKWKGKEIGIDGKCDCKALGISCVYQELSVIPALTVAQNVLLGKEPRIGKTHLIDHRNMNRMVQELIDKYGFPLNPMDSVNDLGIGQRQLVEILKGLSSDADLLIMDEPTASLGGREAEILFSIIDALRDKGVSIIYISHRLEEVYRLADRLTVLRDGKNVAVLEKDEIIPKEVIRLMIGKVVDESEGSVKTLYRSDREAGLEVKGLSSRGVFDNVSFQVCRGEILGLGGLIGAGRTEVVRCIYGIDKFTHGTIYLEGRKYVPTVKRCIRSGFGFVPEDRRNQGFIPLLSINRNTALTNYDLIQKYGPAISGKAELKMCLDAISAVDIRPRNPHKAVGLLSGGNQQKVVLGKWLMRELKLLIVDEPTAGIDVGAKDEIYTILKELARKGVMVILVSSDLQELLRISDRILVMREGRIVKEFSEGTVTQADILAAASGLCEERGVDDETTS